MAIVHDPLMGLKIQLTGRRFKDLRKKLGLTRYRVSKASKVSYRTLEIWDKEKVMPRNHTALRVGRALGLVTPELEEKLRVQKGLKELKQRYHDRRDELARYGFKKGEAK